MERAGLARDSSQYAEVIAEVFVETVGKSAREAMSCEHGHEEITPSLMECLQYVYLHGASPVRKIAWGLEVSLSAASQLVDRLVKKCLVTRRENESDRRLTEVELTSAGTQVVKQMRKRRSEWFALIVQSMPRSKRQAFTEGVEGFLKVALANEENIDRACVRCGEHAPFCVVNKIKSQRAEIREEPES